MRRLSLDFDRSYLAAFFDNIESCSDKNPLTHGLHPYPAKFIPHIPRTLIKYYASEGDLVLDPMCGSGTTLVEAATLGHRAIGVDLNPIAALASRAKTTILDMQDTDAIEDLKAELAVTAGTLETRPDALDEQVTEDDLPTFINRDKWFAFNVAQEVEHARRLIADMPRSRAKQFAEACLSAILVSVSNQESETRWAARPQSLSAGTAIRRLVQRIESGLKMMHSYSATAPAEVVVHEADARSLPLEEASVGLVVTSPPYANSHDYYLYNKLRLFWLGHEVRPVQTREIGSRHRHSDKKEDLDTYLSEMREVMREVSRVLANDGVGIFVVADAVIRRTFYPMDQLFPETAARSGLQQVDAFHFAHQRFNAAFQRGFGTAEKKRTHVLVFEKA